MSFVPNLYGRATLIWFASSNFTDNRSGGRLRSQGERHVPLRYWLNERPVLVRPPAGATTDVTQIVPAVAAWVTRPEPSTSTIPKKRSRSYKPQRKGSAAPIRRGRKADPDSADDSDAENIDDWDKGTEASGMVLMYSPDGTPAQEAVRREYLSKSVMWSI